MKEDVDLLVSQIKKRDPVALARAITLVESVRSEDRKIADSILKSLADIDQKNVKRIGITGIPGVGKSTFIEAFGVELIKKNKTVAVLAIDPSSPRTGGSILGDKTRMSELSRQDNAFIRPSPARGNLGGITLSTQESIFLCGAAGYDYVIVETVGVGQSEFEVSDIVDVLVLLSLPGAGDEIQGIKKGILEVADIFVINKCDGDFFKQGNVTNQQLVSALKIQRPDKASSVVSVSSFDKMGLDKFLDLLESFFIEIQKSTLFNLKREAQVQVWLKNRLQKGILNKILNDEKFKMFNAQVELQIKQKKITAIEALNKILNQVKWEDV